MSWEEFILAGVAMVLSCLYKWVTMRRKSTEQEEAQLEEEEVQLMEYEPLALTLIEGCLVDSRYITKEKEPKEKLEKEASKFREIDDWELRFWAKSGLDPERRWATPTSREELHRSTEVNRKTAKAIQKEVEESTPATVKQLQTIGYIEDNLGIEFDGATKEEARDWIMKHMDESKQVRAGIKPKPETPEEAADRLQAMWGEPFEEEDSTVLSCVKCKKQWGAHRFPNYTNLASCPDCNAENWKKYTNRWGETTYRHMSFVDTSSECFATDRAARKILLQKKIALLETERNKYPGKHIKYRNLSGQIGELKGQLLELEVDKKPIKRKKGEVHVGLKRF